MPTLNWIGKEAVVNHDKEVPFRLLKKVKAHSVEDNSQNLIIKGDNLEGLKALMPYYIGKVKCIYIDPPYNTGNENWVYNDKVNSPKIKKWLEASLKGHSVDANDLCRHDKWLCMMYPRLKLLRDLLSDDGFIGIQCDDNESAHLRLLCDEIFGEGNYRNSIYWKRTFAGKTISKNLPWNVDTILLYSKNQNTNLNNITMELTEKDIASFNKDDNDGRGKYNTVSLQKTATPTKGTKYNYIDNKGKVWKCPEKGWRMVFEKMKALENDNRLYITDKTIRQKYYLNERLEIGKQIDNLWMDIGNMNRSQGENVGFIGQKPLKIMKRIIELTCKEKDAIILDSFAGSGSTGHAVLDLNKEDGGNRKFILIEMEDDIAKKITAERVKRVIEKYDYKDGFEYCELDKPLFDENGQIEETCDFNQFATYIYFTETQTNIDKKQIDKNFIGESGETEYYLIYKEKYKNVLDKKFLSKIKKTKNKKVIYADFCMVDEDEMKKFNIQFKQIPYEVKVY